MQAEHKWKKPSRLSTQSKVINDFFYYCARSKKMEEYNIINTGQVDPIQLYSNLHLNFLISRKSLCYLHTLIQRYQVVLQIPVL